MRFLLTSAGIHNASIATALTDLLGKPVSESTALFVPTAGYPFPGGSQMAWRSITGQSSTPMCELGWKSLGVLELTALPTILRDSWVPAVQEADALLVGGGHVLYLCHWMRRSGLADLLPSLTDTVYVGISAGSIAATPHNCDAEFNLEIAPVHADLSSDADKALGLVDFTLYPHLDDPNMPDTSLANIGRWAATVPAATYAIDDETAIKVVDGEAEVISEGRWELFRP